MAGRIYKLCAITHQIQVWPNLYAVLRLFFMRCRTTSGVPNIVGWPTARSKTVFESVGLPITPGGTLIFSSYVGSDPASIVHPKKISGISSTPKKYLKFQQPKKKSQFCTLTLKKTLKCIEMTLKLAKFCDDPKKYPQNLHTPKKYLLFWKPKKYWNSEFWPPKDSPSRRMFENIRVHPPPPPPPWAYNSRQTRLRI